MDHIERAESYHYSHAIKKFPLIWNFLNGCLIFRTGSVPNRIGLTILLLLNTQSLRADAGALPSDFSIRYQSFGAELVWTANDKRQVMVAGSRPEFRFADGTVLGYPRESPVDGLLVLLMTSKTQDALLTKGQYLEVWYGANRIDNRAPTANRISEIFSNRIKTNITPTPAVNINPAAPGNYTAKRLTYNIVRGLNYSLFPELIEIVAEVTYPQPLPAKSPFILFLHGRHGTCYNAKDPNTECRVIWPCDKGCLPISSHLGYRYVADILASQGFIAVSISANGVNAQDWLVVDGGAEARSILIRRHLNIWARWNTVGGDPWNATFLDKVDLSNVVLVGHSRGGEGVNRAAIDVSPSDPYKIVGLVSYAPTSLGSQVTPDVHSATILPTCDGDVLDLQGQKYIDRSRGIAYTDALRSAVIVLGANHNYFNTEWTPGLASVAAVDDWGDDKDSVCGINVADSFRLSPQEQQIVGAAYTVALVRMSIYQDASMLPFLDGSYVRPASIGRAEVATHAVGGAANRLLYRPEDIGGVQGSRGMVTVECSGNEDSYTTLKQCYYPQTSSSIPYYGSLISPHWIADNYLPSPQASVLKWTNMIRATAIFPVRSDLRDLSSLDSLDIRVANDPRSTEGVRLKIVIQDNVGRNATLNTSLTVIDGWPGSGGLDRIHARAFRGYLASVPEQALDLTNIVYIFLVAQSKSGKIWVLDIAASQAKIMKPVVLDLPIISVEKKDIIEGNGPQSFQMKVISNKPLQSPGSIWVVISNGWNFLDGFLVNLTIGSQETNILVPFAVEGDTMYSSYNQESYLFVGAMKGVVTSNYVGRFDVIEDDPFPTISFQKQVIAVEGQSLIWNLQLSAPTTGISLFCYVVPPRTGTSLYTDDIPISWLRSLNIIPSLQAQPL